MLNVCNHFYALLGQTVANIQPEHEKRVKYSKVLLRYSESPTTVGEEILTISNDEADREVVQSLHKQLNSVWSKDVGLTGLKDYLIQKLYDSSTEGTKVDKRFEAIHYLVNYVTAMNGTLNAVRENNIFSNSKEFLTPGDDSANIEKVNKLRSCVSENGFDDAILNNNLALFFTNVDEFIKSLATVDSGSKLLDMVSKVNNEQLFNLGCEMDVFKDEFKILDVMKEKVNNEAIAGTTSIIKFMEGEANPDHLSTLKAVTNAQATFASCQNKIAETCKSKVKEYISLISEVEKRYADLYANYTPTIQQYIMDTFGQDNVNGGVLNAGIISLSNRIVRLDNYLMQIFYQAHIELVDTVMHIVHFNSIKMLMEGISKLK